MDRLHVLTDEERKATLSQRLVDQCHIVVHPLLELGTFNPDIVSSLPLLDRPVMRGELVNQAEAIFYGRNSFLVWWDALQEFLSPRNGLSTDKLVRRVIVRYSLQELQASRRKLATERQHLFRLTHADSITIDITGGGTPDGSDFATQMVLRDIAAIIQQLIFYFGPRFVIGRSLGEWPGVHDVKWISFRSYWQLPVPSARDRMKSGEASFEETMQLQIESWIQAAKRPELTAPLCGVSGADSPLLGCGTDALTDGISLAVLAPELA
ncbi:hypothetical protein NQ176_g7039 [Zarea fungicola]|uniref:Uncharacterized protein n=1 Tax=Zarea fungicola TaxID=93591 RepID=A0ACC1N165_9HYPO|nr:hypothetical protein NQ176_g7039 [Lecanicillium fungicola]